MQSERSALAALLVAALSGALVTAYAVIGLFFLKFHRRTRDRLFALFATAFFILAAQRLALVVVGGRSEDLVLLYGMRLLAFVLIIVAIVDKNRSAGG